LLSIIRGSIHWKYPPPPLTLEKFLPFGGKYMRRGREKGGKCKRKREKGGRKRKKREEKEQMGSKR
jgi:hypothetical protein